MLRKQIKSDASRESQQQRRHLVSWYQLETYFVYICSAGNNVGVLVNSLDSYSLHQTSLANIAQVFDT